MAEWLIGAANRLLNILRAYTGALSFAGVVSGLKTWLVSGGLTLVSATSRVLSVFRTYLSSITPTSTIIRIIRAARGYTGSISFASAVTWAATKRFITKSTSSVLTFTGALFTGWLYGAVKRVLSMFRTTTGALNMVGTYLYDLGQLNAVTKESFIYFAGVISNFTAWFKSKDGIISFGLGTVSKVVAALRTYSGTLTITGAIQRTISTVAKSYAGTLDFVGNIYKAIERTAYPGALTFVGGLSWLVNYLIVATLTTTGAVIRLLSMSRTYSSGLSFSGLYSYVEGVVQLFYNSTKDGVINLIGDLSASQGLAKSYTGTLNVYGRITIIDAILDRISAASIAPAGVIDRLWQTARDTNIGSVSMSGVKSRIWQLNKTYESALSFVGDLTVTLTGEWNRYPNGDLSFAGAYDRLLNVLRTYSSQLDLAGAIDRLINVSRAPTGGLTFGGVVTNLGVVQADWRLGVLSFAGSYIRTALTSAAPTSTLAFAGGVSRTISIARAPAGAIDFSGKINTRSREILYLGPPNP